MISRINFISFMGKTIANLSAKGMKIGSTNICNKFSEQKVKKQPLGSNLSDQLIHEKVDEKHLAELLQHVKDLENKQLNQHQTNLNKLQEQLSTDQKSRIQKISELLNGLSQGQAEYFRYRVLKAVDA